MISNATTLIHFFSNILERRVVDSINANSGYIPVPKKVRGKHSGDLEAPRVIISYEK